MKSFQKEYEAYMKTVTDGFILMQTDTVISEWNESTSVYPRVIWNGGLKYHFEHDWSLALSGITFEEVKEMNSENAKNYLRENSLTYNEWFNKYKQNENI